MGCRHRRSPRSPTSPRRYAPLLWLLVLVASSFAAEISAAAREVAAGHGRTCAIGVDGGLRCWGDNEHGGIGDGSYQDRLTPTPVAGMEDQVERVDVGWGHTCAIKDGDAFCWGKGGNGELGDGLGGTVPIPSRVQGFGSDVAGIAVGGDIVYEGFSCAHSDGGVMKCWGRNLDGQLGDGSTFDRIVAVDVLGMGDDITSIATGSQHTCAVRNGGVHCWGDNFDSQLGQGEGTGVPLESRVPLAVPGLASGVAQVSAGDSHTCALMTNGGVKCWGWGWGAMPVTSPQDVPGLSQAVAVSVGNTHACAIVGTARAARCWGVNDAGQLGNGFTSFSVLGVTNVLGLESGVRSISAGDRHTCATLLDGGLRCWGANDRGQLGDGSTIMRTSPVEVSLPSLPSPPSIHEDGFESPGSGATTFEEDFEINEQIGARGWLAGNASSPATEDSWWWSDTRFFEAHAGSPGSFVLADYNATLETGIISVWLLTPVLEFRAGSTVRFHTRTVTGAPFADRLEVRACRGEPCDTIGPAPFGVGGFSELLLEINPEQQVGPDPSGINGYPDAWTAFELGPAQGVPTSGRGRIAFRYHVIGGGPTGSHSFAIGLDTVRIEAAPVSGNKPAREGNRTSMQGVTRALPWPAAGHAREN